MADLDHSSDAASVDSSGGSGRDFELEFSEDEEFLIIRMFNLVGERWALIAGRIPGRKAEEIEKYWNSRLDKRVKMVVEFEFLELGVFEGFVLKKPMNFAANSGFIIIPRSRALYNCFLILRW